MPFKHLHGSVKSEVKKFNAHSCMLNSKLEFLTKKAPWFLSSAKELWWETLYLIIHLESLCFHKKRECEWDLQINKHRQSPLAFIIRSLFRDYS